MELTVSMGSGGGGGGATNQNEKNDVVTPENVPLRLKRERNPHAPGRGWTKKGNKTYQQGENRESGRSQGVGVEGGGSRAQDGAS